MACAIASIPPRRDVVPVIVGRDAPGVACLIFTRSMRLCAVPQRWQNKNQVLRRRSTSRSTKVEELPAASRRRPKPPSTPARRPYRRHLSQATRGRGK